MTFLIAPNIFTSVIHCSLVISSCMYKDEFMVIVMLLIIILNLLYGLASAVYESIGYCFQK